MERNSWLLPAAQLHLSSQHLWNGSYCCVGTKVLAFAQAAGRRLHFSDVDFRLLVSV